MKVVTKEAKLREGVLHQGEERAREDGEEKSASEIWR